MSFDCIIYICITPAVIRRNKVWHVYGTRRATRRIDALNTEQNATANLGTSVNSVYK